MLRQYISYSTLEASVELIALSDPCLNWFLDSSREDCVKCVLTICWGGESLMWYGVLTWYKLHWARWSDTTLSQLMLSSSVLMISSDRRVWISVVRMIGSDTTELILFTPLCHWNMSATVIFLFLLETITLQVGTLHLMNLLCRQGKAMEDYFSSTLPAKDLRFWFSFLWFIT